MFEDSQVRAVVGDLNEALKTRCGGSGRRKVGTVDGGAAYTEEWSKRPVMERG